MKIIAPSSLRGRMFVVLLLLSVIPAVLTLLAGTLVLREVVVSSGSAGPWGEVAGSGRELFEEIEAQETPSSSLIQAAERHRAALAESVRFSRLYAFIGERILVVLPLFALLLVVLVGGLAFLAANLFSRGFAAPVEELVEWTRSLASGKPLPSARVSGGHADVSEFAQLRGALRSTSEELARAREREVEQARMRSWSEMARKVAHELKNPLTPMAMAADRVSKSGDPSVSAAGEVLRDEIGRLEELARSFAHFGRPPEGLMSPIELKELLASLVRRLSAEGLPIRFDPPSGEIFVMGHLEALDRVIRNLLSNAQDAVQARIMADASEPGASEGAPSDAIRIEISKSSDRVQIRVLDRGTGIPEPLLARIWEPEFTMKRKGTGLGLAMVRQVVRAHGGEVTAMNREGGGAEFRIDLPIASARSSEDTTRQDRAGHAEDELASDLPGSRVPAS